MQICLKLKGTSGRNTYPTGKIICNDKVLFDGVVQGENEFVYDLDNLTTSNILKIVHYGKENWHTVTDDYGYIINDRAIELLELSFNGIKTLNTVIYNKPFYVQWPKNIIEDYRSKGEEPPKFITNNVFFGFNGVYEFDFTHDVIKDYYNQFWLDEVQAHKNQTLEDDKFIRDGQLVETDIGADRTIFDLEKLILEDKNDIH